MHRQKYDKPDFIRVIAALSSLFSLQENKKCYSWNIDFAFDEKYNLHDLHKFFFLKAPEPVEEEVKATTIKKGTIQ